MNACCGSETARMQSRFQISTTAAGPNGANLATFSRNGSNWMCDSNQPTTRTGSCIRSGSESRAGRPPEATLLVGQICLSRSGHKESADGATASAQWARSAARGNLQHFIHGLYKCTVSSRDFLRMSPVFYFLRKQYVASPFGGRHSFLDADGETFTQVISPSW